ncbi:MAG: YqgE/AlgH family protein [Planctomycetota bacterium]
MMEFYCGETKIFPSLKGSLLIAHPSLKDPNFNRTVVLICHHSEQGALGLVLNRGLDVQIEKALSGEFKQFFPHQEFFQGGPVALSQMFVLHNEAQEAEIPEEEDMDDENLSVVVSEGIVFTENLIYLENEFNHPEKIKFFIGNSGWSPGQLEAELLIGGWILGKANSELVFDTPTQKIWGKALQFLGEPYSLISTWPLVPGLN